MVAGGCATSYEQHGTRSGLKEAQVSRNGFTVSFSGNSHTSFERATDFCLMRSAELTLEHEFRYFVVMTNRTTFTAVSGEMPLYSIPDPGHKPRVSDDLVCFRQKPEMLGSYYDATNVLEPLRTKYHIKRKGVTRHITFRPGEAIVGIRFQTPQYTIHDFVADSDCLAGSSGLEIGDKVISYNGAPVNKPERLADEMDNWSIGDTVEVKVERNGEALSLPVKTIANTWAIGFQLSPGAPEFAPTDPDSVRFFTAKPHFQFVPFATRFDWENPFPTMEEFERYASLEAARIGADGVLVLTNREQIQLLDPKADKNAGFGAWAIKIPDATPE